MNLARIELEPAEIPNIATKSIRSQINAHFKSLGYRYVTLDLQGYRSGSFNEGVLKNSIGPPQQN
jgi:PP-loop superfamily ATP-utilizing enzyme